MIDVTEDTESGNKCSTELTLYRNSQRKNMCKKLTSLIAIPAQYVYQFSSKDVTANHCSGCKQKLRGHAGISQEQQCSEIVTIYTNTLTTHNLLI